MKYYAICHYKLLLVEQVCFTYRSNRLVSLASTISGKNVKAFEDKSLYIKEKSALKRTLITFTELLHDVLFFSF